METSDNYIFTINFEVGQTRLQEIMCEIYTQNTCEMSCKVRVYERRSLWCVREGEESRMLAATVLIVFMITRAECPAHQCFTALLH